MPRAPTGLEGLELAGTDVDEASTPMGRICARHSLAWLAMVPPQKRPDGVTRVSLVQRCDPPPPAGIRGAKHDWKTRRMRHHELAVPLEMLDGVHSRTRSRTSVQPEPARHATRFPQGDIGTAPRQPVTSSVHGPTQRSLLLPSVQRTGCC